MQRWAPRPRASAPRESQWCNFSHGHGESDVVVRSPNFDVSTAPHTLGGARVRAGSLTEKCHASDLDRGGDSGGDPARKGRKRADRAHGGGVLATRSIRAVSASRRRCSEAASARRSSRRKRLVASQHFSTRAPRGHFGSFVGPMKNWHLSSEQTTLIVFWISSSKCSYFRAYFALILLCFYVELAGRQRVG